MRIDRTKLDAMITELLPKNKLVIEGNKRKGVDCYRCGHDTFGATYTIEIDGHARHGHGENFPCQFVRLTPRSVSV
jgi:hypothetical protein